MRSTDFALAKCTVRVRTRDDVHVLSCSYESDVLFATRSRPTCYWHGSVLTGSCYTFAWKRDHSFNLAKLII